MLARLGHRLLAGLAVVLGVVTLTFFLLHLAPGDPVDIMLGPVATAEQRADQRTALGLDRPLPAQFASWLSRFARGDWGSSIAKGRPVRALLGRAAGGPAYRARPRPPAAGAVRELVESFRARRLGQQHCQGPPSPGAARPSSGRTSVPRSASTARCRRSSRAG